VSRASTVTPPWGATCSRMIRADRPISITASSPPSISSVRWAFLARGRRKVGTPLAIASIPVNAEQPAANACSSRITPSASLMWIGWVTPTIAAGWERGRPRFAAAWCTANPAAVIVLPDPLVPVADKSLAHGPLEVSQPPRCKGAAPYELDRFPDGAGSNHATGVVGPRASRCSWVTRCHECRTAVAESSEVALTVTWSVTTRGYCGLKVEVADEID
jgi:hypothetical protein